MDGRRGGRLRACKRAIIFSHSWFFGSFLFGQIAGDFSNSNDIFEKTYQALEILHAFRSKSAFFCVQHSQAGAKPVLRADFFLPTTDLGLRVKPQLRRNISFSIAWKEIVVGVGRSLARSWASLPSPTRNGRAKAMTARRSKEHAKDGRLSENA